MKITSISLKELVPVLRGDGKYDRTAMVLPAPGRTLSLQPGLGILVEAEGHDSQLIPMANVYYVRVVAKGAK